MLYMTIFLCLMFMRCIFACIIALQIQLPVLSSELSKVRYQTEFIASNVSVSAVLNLLETLAPGKYSAANVTLQ